MAQTTGKVTAIDKNGWARVVTERTGACSGCQSNQNCHSCLGNTKIEARALNIAGAKTGDLVSVSIKTATLLKSAAGFYMVPILGLLAGALSGPAIGKIFSLDETISAILIGLAGFAMGFVPVLLYSKKRSSENRLLPIIEKVIMPLERALGPEANERECPTDGCQSGNA